MNAAFQIGMITDMKLTEEFLAKVRKDFENANLPECDFDVFLKGYVACLKRFGGVRR